MTTQLYGSEAWIYDLIYSGKKYQEEVNALAEILKTRGVSKGDKLLDVACGTGAHLVHLVEYFDAWGVDISPEMVEIAKTKLPNTHIMVSDMKSISLHMHFDAVVCMFSAIGYATTLEELNKTLACFGKHLRQDGVVVINPWISSQDFQADTPHMTVYDHEDIKIARVSKSEREGNVSVVEFHYLVSKKGVAGVKHFSDIHRLGLFSQEQMMQALRDNGFINVEFLPDSIGRGLYIGRKG